MFIYRLLFGVLSLSALSLQGMDSTKSDISNLPISKYMDTHFATRNNIRLSVNEQDRDTTKVDKKFFYQTSLWCRGKMKIYAKEKETKTQLIKKNTFFILEGNLGDMLSLAASSYHSPLLLAYIWVRYNTGNHLDQLVKDSDKFLKKIDAKEEKASQKKLLTLNDDNKDSASEKPNADNNTTNNAPTEDTNALKLFSSFIIGGSIFGAITHFTCSPLPIQLFKVQFNAQHIKNIYMSAAFIGGGTLLWYILKQRIALQKSQHVLQESQQKVNNLVREADTYRTHIGYLTDQIQGIALIFNNKKIKKEQYKRFGSSVPKTQILNKFSEALDMAELSQKDKEEEKKN